MKTTPVTFEDLARSVLAVPPLARNADLSLAREANRKLIRHMEAGGVSTLMYGGNANFYHLPVSELAATIEHLAELAGPDSWLIPSVGPDYGKMIDALPVLKNSKVPTVMALPCSFPFAPAGIARGFRLFAEKLGRPVLLYIKQDNYIAPSDVQRLIADGLVCAIKYAVVRRDPLDDVYLKALTDVIDRRYIISGIGERPAVAHLTGFGLAAFTSGSVCLAPRASTAILRALKAGRKQEAEDLRAKFLALEDLRDGLSPIRVLHEAVTLSGIADMGPILPLFANLDAKDHPAVAAAAKALLEFDRGLASRRAAE
jgi:dihydrodipicolinate synthase/N-acetylneuraminate lyase